MVLKSLEQLALLAGLNHFPVISCQIIINRPGAAGAVLQTPLSLIKSVRDPFPPDIQQTFLPNPLELGS